MTSGLELAKLLEVEPPATRPTGPPISLGNHGGLSGTRLWRYPSISGPLAIRLWPSEEKVRSRLERVHVWLDRLKGLAYIPAPIPDRDGRTLRTYHERFWQVEPWKPGVADLGRPPSLTHLRESFRALAKVHARLDSESIHGPSPGLVRRLAEIRALRAGGLDLLAAAIRGEASEAIREQAGRWIGLARRLAGGIEARVVGSAGRATRLQPCLRDARPDHFLWSGNELTGLVDFGAMDIESPAADLARLLAGWVVEDRGLRSEAQRAYEGAGRAVKNWVELIEAFEASSALLGGERWVRWLVLEGRRFDDPDAARAAFRRAIDRLERHEEGMSADLFRHQIF